LKKLEYRLRKDKLYIYESTYMYFDYYLAMMMSTVLLIFSPIIRILSEELKKAVFDYKDDKDDNSGPSIGYI